MSKHLNVHIIERARALIADEAHWCRRRHCHLNRNLQANEHGRNDFTLRLSRGAMSA